MTKKDMRLKVNWSKDRMMNLLYRNGKCRYCDQPKGKPHKLLDINEIPLDKRSRFFDSKGKGGEFWHDWDVLLGNIKIKWTK
jgi:hypothetical protein